MRMVMKPTEVITLKILMERFMNKVFTYKIQDFDVQHGRLLVSVDTFTDTHIHSLFADLTKETIHQVELKAISPPKTEYFDSLSMRTQIEIDTALAVKKAGYENRTEAIRQKEILTYLDSRGDIFHFKIHQQSFYTSTRGIADILAVYKGLFLAFEVKSKSGRLSGHQKLFKKNVEVAGGIFTVVRCVDDVIEALEMADTK